MIEKFVRIASRRSYQQLNTWLSPRQSLYVKNSLQRVVEARAQSLGLTVTTSDVLIPDSAKGGTIFIVAPGASLNSLNSEQWSHVDDNFSIGLGGSIFLNHLLKSYLSEYPPVLSEISAKLSGSKVGDEDGYHEMLWHLKLSRLKMKMLPVCLADGHNYMAILRRLKIEEMPHLKMRYLAHSSKQLYFQNLAKFVDEAKLDIVTLKDRFPQTSSTLPSVLLFCCMRRCERIVLLGADLSEEYFSDSQTASYRFDSEETGIRSTRLGVHITEGGEHLRPWQRVSAQLEFFRLIFPQTKILIGTPSGPLTELIERYDWPLQVYPKSLK